MYNTTLSESTHPLFKVRWRSKGTIMVFNLGKTHEVILLLFD